MTNDDGGPKIKLYLDDNGRFKGEALVSYFKEGSVDLAIRLFDDTELELGSGMGNMRVSRAEYSGPSKVELKLKQKAQEEAAAASNGAGGEHESGADNVVVGEGKKKKKPKIKDEDQKKAAKRYWALQR
jgi:HIV Tat-specific factor 1